MIVKICGIKNIKDALVAVDAGADMLGFNFYPKSVRFIELEVCSKIVNSLKAMGKTVISVGVFVNEKPEQIQDVMETCGLDLAQLSGDEPPEDLTFLENKAFKAVRPKSMDEADKQLQKYTRDKAPALLVDAHVKGAYGGTGETGDWALAQYMTKQKPILLAGGLNPDNVASAVAAVDPWGVDVASGVESSPGIKDASKIAIFIKAARSGEL